MYYNKSSIFAQSIRQLSPYGKEHSEFVALRSLTYFEDAETYGIPPMFADMDWEELKRSIIKAVNDYTA